jgi:hypothetical protein
VRILLFFLFLHFLISCVGSSGGSEIYGSWKNTGTSKDIVSFNRDGTMLDTKVKFEIVTSVEPKQIYVIIEDAGEVTRVPFGIYDIRGNKLILSPAKLYQRTYGGIGFGGISRSELPKDFTGEVIEYERIE